MEQRKDLLTELKQDIDQLSAEEQRSFYRIMGLLIAGGTTRKQMQACLKRVKTGELTFANLPAVLDQLEQEAAAAGVILS